MLHYAFIRDEPSMDDFSTEGNTEYLKTRGKLSRIHDATLPEIKAALQAQGIACRPSAGALIHA
jgi:hypothetical protein